MGSKEQPTIVILGPTASGKTGLSFQIAKELGNTEIICADSRTIYRGMNIGTAKPTFEEQKIAPHHFLDILGPNQRYSAAEFQKSVQKLIRDIKKRGNVPMLVGGSGLYIFSIIYDYSFPAGATNSRRKELEEKNIDELRSILQYLDADTYSKIDTSNPRRLVRAIETAGLHKVPNSQLVDNVCVLGLKPELSVLEDRIRLRTSLMIRDGLVDEVRTLVNQYGPDAEPLQTVGYREIIDFLDKKISLEEAEELINVHSRQLARRQITWFKRSKDIKWVNNYPDALKEIKKFTQI